MAKYSIKQLNYIACGDVRNFINMDLELGYEIYDYVHLLCAESKSSGYPNIEAWRQHTISNNISVDIGTEHGDGNYYNTNYIFRDNATPLSRENAQTSVILNEYQQYFKETDPNGRKYIRLYLSCCTNQMLQKIAAFNKNRKSLNQTYLLENTANDKNNLSSDTGIIIQNAYDVRDISIKKLGRHEADNDFLVGHDTLYPSGGKYECMHHDIYAAPMKQSPIGFCQSNLHDGFMNDVVLITEKTTAMPLQFETDIENYRGVDDQKKYFNIGLTQQKPRSYAYKPGTEDYALSDVFIPDRSYNGIYRQFILDLPVDEDFASNSIVSEYDSGEIYYHRLMTCKNLYDSQYSMNMPTKQQLSAARTYCGINTYRGKTYIKYWDDVNYSVLSSDSSSIEGMQTISSNSYDDTVGSDYKPYQKIECLEPNDCGGYTKHKSNVFSIEILSTGIDDMESEQLAVLDGNSSSSEEKARANERISKLNILKRDITAAVREIVKNITPANTQLFDVQFKDN